MSRDLISQSLVANRLLCWRIIAVHRFSFHADGIVGCHGSNISPRQRMRNTRTDSSCARPPINCDDSWPAVSLRLLPDVYNPKNPHPIIYIRAKLFSDVFNPNFHIVYPSRSYVNRVINYGYRGVVFCLQ